MGENEFLGIISQTNIYVLNVDEMNYYIITEIQTSMLCKVFFTNFSLSGYFLMHQYFLIITRQYLLTVDS